MSDNRVVLLDLDGTVLNRQYGLTVDRAKFVSAIGAAEASGTKVGFNPESAVATVREFARGWDPPAP